MGLRFLVKRTRMDGPVIGRVLRLIAPLIVGLTLAGCAGAVSSASSNGGSIASGAAPTPVSGRSTPEGSETRASSRTDQAYKTKIIKIVRSTIDLLMRSPAPGRPHSYANGVFRTEGESCWRCDVAPGMAAADLARLFPRRARYRQVAIATFNAMISHHTYPDGSFGPPIGEPNDEISDTEVLNYLGVAYLDLKSWLSPAVKQRWLISIRRAADYLVPTLDYYVNGNINLDLTLSMYLAYRATRDPAFLADYNRSYEFTLYPPQNLWPGFGLHFAKQARAANDSDGDGYLAEKGAGAPGFDPHYTTVQVGTLATLYALWRQPRSLRLLNLETNILLLRTNPKTDYFNGSGGSRGPATSYGYLESAGPPILLLAGHREDLTTVVTAELNEISLSFRNYAVQDNDQDGPVAVFANLLLLFIPGI